MSAFVTIIHFWPGLYAMSKSAPASLYMCSASVNLETREEKESIVEELEDGADKNDKVDLNEKGHVSNTSTLFSIM